jgi:hypothetical protein
LFAVHEPQYFQNRFSRFDAWSGTPGTSFGVHIWHRRKAVLNQHIFKVIPNERLVDKVYLKYAINQTLGELWNGPATNSSSNSRCLPNQGRWSAGAKVIWVLSRTQPQTLLRASRCPTKTVPSGFRSWTVLAALAGAASFEPVAGSSALDAHSFLKSKFFQNQLNLVLHVPCQLRFNADREIDPRLVLRP